jgi:hypothetical protein
MTSWDYWQRARLGHHLVWRGKPIAHVWCAGRGTEWYGQLLTPGSAAKGPFHDEGDAKRAMERLVEKTPKPPKTREHR